MADKKKDIVQIKNPRTGHYVKIDREEGESSTTRSRRVHTRASPLPEG